MTPIVSLKGYALRRPDAPGTGVILAQVPTNSFYGDAVLVQWCEGDVIGPQQLVLIMTVTEQGWELVPPA